MPGYLYACEKCGKSLERFFTIAQRKKSIRCPCGGRARRDMALESAGHKSTAAGWPLYSDSAGVHPDQRQDAYDQSVKDGVPTNFDKLGRAVFTSRSHRKRYLKTIGFFDRDGGYGD